MVRSRWLIAAALAVVLSAAGAAQESLSPLARSIQSDLARLDSRATTRADRLESDRIQRTPRERGQAARLFTPSGLRSAQDISRSSDLDAARQDLRTLKTQEPDAAATPLLEQQLDRIVRDSRGTVLFQPSRSPAALYAR